MKVLFVVHDFLPEHAGGTEVHTAQLARAIAGRGHDVAVACTERDLSAEEGTFRERVSAGVRTLELVHQREYADLSETWLEPRSARAFAALLARERPDVVHFQHFARWGAACVELARDAGAARVVTLHDYHLLCHSGTLLGSDGELCDDPDTAVFESCSSCLAELSLRGNAATAMGERRAFHRRALSLAQCVIAPSHFLADLFARAGWLPRERIEVLGSGCDGPWREPRTGDPSRPLRVAYVGGLYPAKGAHVLIEAMRQLAGEAIELDVHGVLEWFPDYVRELQARARDLPVRFRGRFEPTEIDALLARADVLAVPSLWYENRPLTIQDAFRNGLCVVASDLGGMAELVEHERSGLLFPRGDATALASALRRLAHDRVLLERLARGRPSLPGIAEVAERTLELYSAAQRART